MRKALRCAVLGLFLSATAALSATPDRDIASLYVDAAAEALENEEYARAGELIAVAEEFAPEASDVHYLRALLEARNRESVRDAVRSVSSAVEHETWGRFTPAHGQIMLAELLNRTARYEDARVVLEAVTEESTIVDLPEELVARRYRALLQALWRSGREERIRGVLERARDRFPDDPRIYRYLLLREPIPSVEYRREIERLMQAGHPGMEQLLFEYARRAPAEAELTWAIAELRRRGWTDAALAVLQADLDEPTAVELFFNLEGLRDYDAYRSIEARLSPPYREELSRAAARFSGTSVADFDHDGYWNERITVKDGLIATWERDLDQDGIVEIEVGFDEEEPAFLTRRDGEVSVVARYGQYPYVTDAEIAVEGGTERYRLRPRSVRLDAVEHLSEEGPMFASELRLLPGIRALTRRELIATAIQIDLVTTEGVIVERTLREAGARTKTMRDENRDGRWDHLVLTRGGLAVTGVRDLDGDGYYEVAEGYRNGRLIALAIDADKNGQPEVFERRGETPVREWDLNEDGRIDVREFSYWTDAVLREFPFAEQE